jgi:uncharacterized NAD(P)/FAD-binding protein YdhS
MSKLEVAIVGLGPWGLCVLERLLSGFLKLTPAERSLHVHCFEPNSPGAGVHDTSEPDYLLLNTVAGQVSLFAAADRDGLSSHYQSKSFLQWVRDEGYALPAVSTCAGSEERPIAGTDFLPRSMFGRYALWCFHRLIDCLPPGVEVTLHRDRIERIDNLTNGLERLQTSAGTPLHVHHVFLTTGHTSSNVDERMVAVYPADNLLARVPDRADVAITGMGLVAVDALAALTYGRGGSFARAGDGRLEYRASGREPSIRLLSRSGLCFQCRPASTLDSTGSYAPSVFTNEAITRLRQLRERETGSRQLDFERDVSPLLWAELRIHYQAESARLSHGVATANDLRCSLVAAWRDGTLDAKLATLPHFDPEFDCYRPDLDRCHDRVAYQAAIRTALEADIDDCRVGEERAPRKAAFELFRVLRNVIRCAVEDSGLTFESFLSFRRRFAGAVNRVAVGPPLQRGEELLALMDAGIVTIPFGRRPSCRYSESDGTWQVSSTRLEQPHVEHVDAIIAGHLGLPDVANTTSPLLRSLTEAGRTRSYCHGASCGIAVDEQQHPVGRGDTVSKTLWVLGPLTEGARYFTNYLPSPKSRFKAFEEAEQCVQSIFSKVRWS